jgi:hypothetical protein
MRKPGAEAIRKALGGGNGSGPPPLPPRPNGHA